MHRVFQDIAVNILFLFITQVVEHQMDCDMVLYMDGLYENMSNDIQMRLR